MKLIINPSDIFGSIYVQLSKSDVHRALIASSLSNEVSIIRPWMSKIGIDIDVTKDAMSNFANFEFSNYFLKVIPKKENLKELVLDVKESGTTLRLLIPIMSALGINCTFKGAPRLFKRPLDIYKKIWNEQGLVFDIGKKSIRIEGKLKSGIFKIVGNVSSQFLSGLLFSLPLLDGDSKILIDGELQSKTYVLMTYRTLKEAKIETHKVSENEIVVLGNQVYSALDYELESDWSHAAFFAAAGVLGGEVTLYGVNKYSIQGDKEILNILKYMGASIIYNSDNSITLKKASRLNSLDIDVSNIPDLAPVLVALAVTAKGTTKIYNAGRLKYKESDRLNDLKDSFNRVGAKIDVTDEEIYIYGVEKIEGGHTTSHNDHRIAMALAIAGISSKNPIIIDDAQSIYKSSFGFIDQFKSIGGNLDILD